MNKLPTYIKTIKRNAELFKYLNDSEKSVSLSKIID